MFNFFRKMIKTVPVEQGVNPMYDFKWYDLGESNPFNTRILDIRPYTQQMISTTQDPRIAELFLINRKGIGQQYIEFEFKNGVSTDVHLTYSHDGKKIEGVGYKASTMEDKWDIYAWNDIIYFVRSWTGDVGYKAFITYNDKSFTVYKIEFEAVGEVENQLSIATNNVHFLISTLAFKAVQPHKIPDHLVTNEEIAAYSFSIFGRNCWYATYDDIINLTIIDTNTNA